MQHINLRFFWENKIYPVGLLTDSDWIVLYELNENKPKNLFFSLQKSSSQLPIANDKFLEDNVWHLIAAKPSVIPVNSNFFYFGFSLNGSTNSFYLLGKCAKIFLPEKVFIRILNDLKNNLQEDIEMFVDETIVIQQKTASLQLDELKEQFIQQTEDILHIEADYQQLFDQAADGILVGQKGGIITKSNKSMEVLSGYKTEELIGQNISLLFPADILQKTPLRYDLVLKGNRVRNERIIKRKDGQLINVEMHTQILNDGRMQAFFRDISDRVKIENELKMYRNYLEDLVRTRTEEIDQLNKKLQKTNIDLQFTNDELSEQKFELETTLQQLKDMQSKLVNSEKMASLGVLTAGLAHEINNPINFIHTTLGELKDANFAIQKFYNAYLKYIEKSDCNFANALKTIQEQEDLSYTLKMFPELIANMETGVRRTVEIIKGMRLFSRLDQNAASFVNLNDSINSTLLILKHQYFPRIEIIKNFANLPTVECFAGKLHQAFMNILSNSIQAIELEGTIEITTKFEELAGEIHISIKDSGTGIPEEILDKIFEPFFTTKDVGKGTGLGLSITYGIIKEHNGEIKVVSKKNEGTEVIIRIPQFINNYKI